MYFDRQTCPISMYFDLLVKIKMNECTFQIFTVVTTNSNTFWKIMPCHIVWEKLIGMHCLQIQG
jgi:hypothetical protein